MGLNLTYSCAINYLNNLIGNEKNMKNSIVLMLLLVISNIAHADISFTEQEIPKVIANNGYEFTVPYLELETPFGITAYTVKLIAPPGQLTFSVDLSTLKEVTLKPRVSITKPTGYADDEEETISSSLITIVENNATTNGFDFPVIPGEMDGWKEPPPAVPETDPNFDPSSYLTNRADGIHPAIDFYREDGSNAGGYELWAIGDGVVVDIVYDRETYPDKHDGSDEDEGWGNLILIQHDYVENGVNKRVYAQYAHCQTIEVELHQTVTRGQRVGLVGGTNGEVGTDFDNHLHFELRTTNLKADAWPQSIGITTDEAVSQHYTHPLEFIRTHRP